MRYALVLLIVLAPLGAPPAAAGCLLNIHDSCRGQRIDTHACPEEERARDRGDTVDVQVARYQNHDSCDGVDVTVLGEEDGDGHDLVDAALLSRERGDGSDTADAAVGGFETEDGGDVAGVNVLPQVGCAARVDVGATRVCAPSLDRRTLP